MYAYHNFYASHFPAQLLLFLSITNCLRKKKCKRSKVIIRLDCGPSLIDSQACSSPHPHNPKHPGHLSAWVFATVICVHSLIEFKFSVPNSSILPFGTPSVTANCAMSLMFYSECFVYLLALTKTWLYLERHFYMPVALSSGGDLSLIHHNIQAWKCHLCCLKLLIGWVAFLPPS